MKHDEKIFNSSIKNFDALPEHIKR